MYLSDLITKMKCKLLALPHDTKDDDIKMGNVMTNCCYSGRSYHITAFVSGDIKKCLICPYLWNEPV